MHVVIDARIIASTTGVMIERLLHHLQQLDDRNRYTVLIDRADDGFWSPAAANFEKRLVDVPNFSFAEQTRLRRVLRELRPDVVHFCMPQQPLFFAQGRKITSIYDLIILRTRNPRKSALTSLFKRSVGWFALRRAARESARVLTLSRYSKDDLVAHLGVPADKVQVIYPAADAKPAQLAPVEHPFGRFLMFVGRQPAYKNLDGLCDAHQLLLDRFPDLGLIVVGKLDSEGEATRERCRRSGYRNILFTGFLDTPRRDWLYANTAAYVFPSFAEGFGLPGLEAMGYGAPVVSSNATCLPEVYGDAALYFDPGDTRGMADAIARVLVDDGLRRSLVEKGRARFDEFSWRRWATETLAAYEAVGDKVRLGATKSD